MSWVSETTRVCSHPCHCSAFCLQVESAAWWTELSGWSFLGADPNRQAPHYRMEPREGPAGDEIHERASPCCSPGGEGVSSESMGRQLFKGLCSPGCGEAHPAQRPPPLLEKSGRYELFLEPGQSSPEVCPPGAFLAGRATSKPLRDGKKMGAAARVPMAEATGGERDSSCPVDTAICPVAGPSTPQSPAVGPGLSLHPLSNQSFTHMSKSSFSKPRRGVP